MKRSIATLLAVGGLAFVLANTARAEELTIFWAEWDPANYLQELVNDYTKETGVKVTVETTPWSDFQTKTFREFAAKGSAYDMVVGDFAMAGRGIDPRSLCRPDRLLQEKTISRRLFLPATVVGYAEYPIGSHNTGPYRWRATPTVGPIARTGSRTRRKRRRLRPNTATNSACPRTTSSCATLPNSSIGPIRSATVSRSTPTIPMTRSPWASSRLSSAMAATLVTMPPTR